MVAVRGILAKAPLLSISLASRPHHERALNSIIPEQALDGTLSQRKASCRAGEERCHLTSVMDTGRHKYPSPLPRFSDLQLSKTLREHLYHALQT